MLEGVDGGDPAENAHDPLEVLPAGALRLLRGVEDLQMGSAQKLHAHGGDFRKLQGGVAVGHQRLLARGKRVEGVPALVEQGPDVPVPPHRVHEDERQPVLL